MISVEEFLDLKWTPLKMNLFRVEVMRHDGHEFKVRHVSDDVHMGFIDGKPVGLAKNMEAAVRMIYAQWLARGGQHVG